ncbi:major facilitator superfamily domain-containing protein [Thamnocephalis sphaerospora]|uniref:Major facilitator superfamily domain-containing protein n=1 Tax=Thamnocephalis sphaerospora TaxID=78915 RepID=A0A4P9XT64_9FUNG|nr:major facilitator superfamily domain-containing protein [Thamnocephalis sphaerospora]|eukprot:RKP09337.1 major facilitator superfamily domain-containing protein [Thamnocephalis sphaerospora]
MSNTTSEQHVRSRSVGSLESQQGDNLPLRFAHVVLVFTALCLLTFLSTLETTIVSTAAPAIASSLGGLDRLSWMANAYMLSSTIGLPVIGRLSDTFGRLPVVLAAGIVFMGGNALCGAAQSMTMLIIARAVAGIGGGCFGALNFIITCDISSLRLRSIFQGLAAAVFAISSIVGPLLGGVFADDLGWRWSFYFNLPFGIVALLILCIWLRLPPPTGSTREKLKQIDYMGSFLITSATVCLLLATSWGGDAYAWSSPVVIILFVASAVLTAAFWYVEFRIAVDPIMPRRLFRRCNVGISFLHHLLFGIPYIVTIFYMPVWFQVVRGDSATRSGMKMLPLILSSSLVSVAVSGIISLTGHIVPLIALGSMGLTVSMSLLGTLSATSSETTEILYMVLSGVSAGIVIQPMLFSAQLATHKKDIGVTTTLLVFFRYIGSIIGISICSAVFNNVIVDRIHKNLPDISEDQLESIRSDISTISSQPDDVRIGIINSFVDALNTTLFICALFPAIMVILCLAMDRERIKFTKKSKGKKAEAASETKMDTEDERSASTMASGMQEICRDNQTRLSDEVCVLGMAAACTEVDTNDESSDESECGGSEEVALHRSLG